MPKKDVQRKEELGRELQDANNTGSEAFDFLIIRVIFDTTIGFSILAA